MDMTPMTVDQKMTGEGGNPVQIPVYKLLNSKYEDHEEGNLIIDETAEPDTPANDDASKADRQTDCNGNGDFSMLHLLATAAVMRANELSASPWRSLGEPRKPSASDESSNDRSPKMSLGEPCKPSTSEASSSGRSSWRSLGEPYKPSYYSSNDRSPWRSLGEPRKPSASDASSDDGSLSNASVEHGHSSIPAVLAASAIAASKNQRPGKRGLESSPDRYSQLFFSIFISIPYGH
jgi:hypothetical protein